VTDELDEAARTPVPARMEMVNGCVAPSRTLVAVSLDTPVATPAM